MKTDKLVLISLCLLGAAACGAPQEPVAPAPTAAATAAPTAAPAAVPPAAPTAAPAAAPTAAPAAPAGPSEADMKAACARMMERELSCKDDLMPVLVDARIKLDVPAGIAAKGKGKAGRDKLVAEAKKEIVVDHAADKVPAACEGRIKSTPADMMADLQAMGDKCMAEKDCKGFATCMGPLFEKVLPKMAAPEPAKADAKKPDAPKADAPKK